MSSMPTRAPVASIISRQYCYIRLFICLPLLYYNSKKFYSVTNSLKNANIIFSVEMWKCPSCTLIHRTRTQLIRRRWSCSWRRMPRQQKQDRSSCSLTLFQLPTQLLGSILPTTNRLRETLGGIDAEGYQKNLQLYK